MTLIPLTVVLPFILATALAVASSHLPRFVADLVATLTAATVTVFCAILLVQSVPSPLVYAFGGWVPQHRIVLGVLFVVDPLSAGLATLVAALVTATLLYSWRYFDSVRNLYHVLMLVFLAAMVGFALSGDIFNMFVFFELMSVSAYTLTAYKIEDTGPLLGAINFAISNTIGAFLVLSGIALLYGRTGALNLAQLGDTLAHERPDGLIVMAFVLITSGFFVKAAIVPFHFWMADAHAVAPIPVCVLFSGIMDELALYAVARIYWSVFSGTLGADAHIIRAILLVGGVVTLLLGAVMCLLQSHLKRMLAFTTLSHMGMFLIGVALFTPLGMAGSALLILDHALVKGALFFCAGILLHHFKTVSICDLRGRGRKVPFTGVLFFVGGLGLAALPPFGSFLGKGLIEDTARTVGFSWIPVALILESIFTGGAVLRAGAHIFFGWGRFASDVSSANEGRGESESSGSPGRTPFMMMFPAALLLLVSLVLGVIPHLGDAIETASVRFQDRSAYAAVVLAGVRLASTSVKLAPATPTTSMVISGIISTSGAALLALLALFWYRLPLWMQQLGDLAIQRPISILRALQSGHVGDYVTWIVVGVAVFGGASALLLH